MKESSNQGGFADDDEELSSRHDTDPLAAVIFDFEDTGDALSLLPLAARRALDVAGFRLSLEGWQSLGIGERKDLSIEGGRDAVDPSAVEHAVRRSAIPATRIRPVPDPDALLPPEQLSTFLGPRRAIDPAQWARLRSLDRYALIHVLRRSIAHDDPIRLEAAIGTILPRGASVRPTPSDRRTSGRPARRASPGPGAPARLKPKDSSATVRPGPSVSPRPRMAATERPVSPVTSRSEREVPRSPQPTAPVRLPNRAASVRDPRDAFDSLDDPGARFSRSGSGGPPRTARGREIAEEDDFGHPIVDDELHRDEGFRFDEDRPIGESYSTHLSNEGEARMVDVGAKDVTLRRATAQGIVQMQRETALRVVESKVPKGDVLATARIAGIMAAKRTPELVPLCHQIALTKVEVHLGVDPKAGIVTVQAVVEARDRTGCEMEALAAVSAACLTVYDMLKGIDRDMSLSDIKVLEKSGGRTGSYVRRED